MDSIVCFHCRRAVPGYVKGLHRHLNWHTSHGELHPEWCFYDCTFGGCKARYKNFSSLKLHILQVHPMDSPSPPLLDSCAYTREEYLDENNLEPEQLVVTDSVITEDEMMAGIIEWVQVDDPIPTKNNDTPVLYMRGKFPEDNSCGVISWKNITIPMQRTLLECFQMLCSSMVVFNIDCRPSDKQFFVFVKAVFMGVGNITTTGEKFLRILG